MCITKNKNKKIKIDFKLQTAVPFTVLFGSTDVDLLTSCCRLCYNSTHCGLHMIFSGDFTVYSKM